MHHSNSPFFTRCRGPVSRRSFLEIGALGLLGLGLGDVLRAETAARSAGRKLKEKSVIFIWLPGGMSHLESYDMKPDAPLEYRGLLSPIRPTCRASRSASFCRGTRRCADKFTLIRSVHHEFADHGGGHKRFLTGRDPGHAGGYVNDAPAVTSIVNKLLSRPEQADAGRACWAWIRAGRGSIPSPSARRTSERARTPFMVAGDPSAPGFQGAEHRALAGDGRRVWTTACICCKAWTGSARRWMRAG